MSTADWVKLVSIPFFTGAIGSLINWTGLIMLFKPGSLPRVPRPRPVRALDVVAAQAPGDPGHHAGGIGWQGIVPARAAKMGSIAVEKAIAKLGTPAEFYQQLEPDEIAAHIVSVFEPEVPAIVDRTMRQEHPGLWQNVPPRGKQAVYARVQEQLPAIVGQITDEIGVYIAHQWWLLPILGVIVGWMTNLLGMCVIFEPVDVRHIGPFRLHGLFLRRQDEVADVYAGIIADEVVTLENIGNFLHGGGRRAGRCERRPAPRGGSPSGWRTSSRCQPVRRRATGIRPTSKPRPTVTSRCARCARRANCCCAGRETSVTSSTRIRRTSESFLSSRPTRAGFSPCCAGRAAAGGRRADRRPAGVGQIAADCPWSVDDRAASGMPLCGSGPGLPEQPVPPRDGVVLTREVWARDGKVSHRRSSAGRPSMLSAFFSRW